MAHASKGILICTIIINTRRHVLVYKAIVYKGKNKNITTDALAPLHYSAVIAALLRVAYVTPIHMVEVYSI